VPDRGGGYRVLWASEGSRQDTAAAKNAGLTDVRTARRLAGEAHVILSICPRMRLWTWPGRARVHQPYLDADAIAPGTAREVAQLIPIAGAGTQTAASSGLRRSRPEAPGCTCPARPLPRWPMCFTKAEVLCPACNTATAPWPLAKHQVSWSRILPLAADIASRERPRVRSIARRGINFYRLLLRAGIPARCRQVMATMHGTKIFTIACPEISRDTARDLAAFCRDGNTVARGSRSRVAP
jgi:hypothetical protein